MQDQRNFTETPKTIYDKLEKERAALTKAQRALLAVAETFRGKNLPTHFSSTLGWLVLNIEDVQRGCLQQLQVITMLAGKEDGE